MKGKIMDKLTFGKYQGSTLEQVYQRDPNYIQWLSEKAYQRVIRDAAQKILDTKKREAQVFARELREAFIQMVKDRTYPGISGRVRYLETESRPGFAEIVIGSRKNVMDLNDDDFMVSITTCNPGEYEERIGELVGHDTEVGEIIIINANPNIRNDEIPSLERAIWYACDYGASKAFNEQPVTAQEALQLLSDQLKGGC
jgi:hypothetical protein